MHSKNQKNSKGKKMKRKERNKGTCTTKKNRIEKVETQLEKWHCRTGTGRRHRSYE